MAWEIRNGRRVYYRSRRDGRRVGREYFGAGPEAHLAAALDARRRSDALQEREARRAGRAAWGAAAAALDDLAGLSDLLVRAALLAAGYHQHDRGLWRKKSHGNGD